MKISTSTLSHLRCPRTGASLSQKENFLIASTAESEIRYPIIDGVPVLINEQQSLFSIDDFVKRDDPDFFQKGSPLVNLIHRLTPSISRSFKTRQNFEQLADQMPSNGKLLVIGGSVVGHSMESLYENDKFELTGTDVCFGTQTDIICDGHDLPFADETFDGVVLQAVLEHVLDPTRVVKEATRVLKQNGMIYAETPFMQQVHMREYDFTRFTHLGHRRLFRDYEEISSGPSGGPGMALAWSYTYFFRSFSKRTMTRRLLMFFAQWTSFFWPYFDHWLIDRPGSYDAAAGYFFFGKKGARQLSDHELIEQFRGI